MRRLPGLLLLMIALAARAAPEEAPDPLAGLPGALRPGAAADFTKERRGESLAATVKWRVLPGETPDTVLAIRESTTGDLGPLTFRDRLAATLAAPDGGVLAFDYETGGAGEEPLRRLARLSADEGPGRFVHERFEYPGKGEPRIRRTVIEPRATFVLDLLEPFAGGLAPAGAEVLEVARGRLSPVTVRYAALGEGEMAVGGAKVPCRIFTRRRGEESAMVYYRIPDMMVLKHDPSGLTFCPARTEEPK
jgi:hypothetical protein